MTKNMRFRFEMDRVQDILKRRGLEKRGEVQKFIDTEVLRYSAPYTPFDTGSLMRSSQTATDAGSGEVVWNTPYARYQYYGKVMVGLPPKQVTDIDLKYQGGGRRGAFWFERMKADHREDILRGAAKIAGGKAK